MTVTLLIDGNQGKAAIYTGNDDLPFAAPLSYPERTLFHTDLPTIGIKTTATAAVSLPAKAALGGTSYLSGRTTYAVLAHGQTGGVPYVEGVITSGLSKPVTLAGSVLLHANRWVHLGADGNYVYLNDMWLQTPAVAVPGFSLGITIYVTDKLL